MLIEARNYVAIAYRLLEGRGYWGGLLEIFKLDWITERLTSRIFYLTSTQACGIDVACQNGAQILLVSSTAGLLGWFLYEIGRSMKLALGFSFFWIFSLGVMQAVSWQATALDKLCALFAVISLNLVCFNIRFFRSTLGILTANLILTAALALAFMSKEHGILIGPAAISLHLLLTAFQSRKLFVSGLRKIVLPCVFFAIYFVQFFKKIVLALLGPAAANISADPREGWKLFFAFLNNFDARHSAAGAVVALVIGFILFFTLALIWIRSRQKPLGAQQLRDVGIMLWALGVSVVMLGVIVKIPTRNMYYMCVPGLFFYTFLLMLSQTWTGLLGRTRFSQALIGLAFSILAIHHFIGFRVSYHWDFAPLVEESDHFMRSKDILVGVMGERAIDRKMVFVSKFEHAAYMFIFTYDASYVGSFLFQDPRFSTNGESNIRHFVEGSETRLNFMDDTYYLFYDDQLTLRKIIENGKIRFLKET